MNKNETKQTQQTAEEIELERVWKLLWEFSNQSINTDGVIDREKFIEHGRKRFCINLK